MKKIPPQLRLELSADPFYKRCAVTWRTDEKIEWHHNLIYAGSQVNEKFCIIPLSKSIHDHIVHYKELVDWIMLNRATNEEIRKYSKAINYLSMLKKLNHKYGVWTIHTNIMHTIVPYLPTAIMK